MIYMHPTVQTSLPWIFLAVFNSPDLPASQTVVCPLLLHGAQWIEGLSG